MRHGQQIDMLRYRLGSRLVSRLWLKLWLRLRR